MIYLDVKLDKSVILSSSEWDNIKDHPSASISVS